MWQGPAPFFLRTIALMKAWATRLDTLTHHQGQFPETRQRGHRTMTMIGHPEELATLLTAFLQRYQCLFMRRFQARSSSSHDPSPVVLSCLLLLSAYTCCQAFFAIQRYSCGKRADCPRT